MTTTKHGRIAAVIALALAPLGCDGGVGLGIATLGVSAVFAGTSPGWALRDPDYATATTRPTPEGDIALAAGESVERCLVLGGELRSPVVVEGIATTSAPPATLGISLFLARADHPAGFSGAIPLDTETVTLTTAAPQAFRVELAFTRSQSTIAFPGDVAVIRFAVPATGGPVTIDTSGARVRTEVRMTQRVVLTAVDESTTAGVIPRLAEDVDTLLNAQELVLRGSGPHILPYPLTILAQATYTIAGTPSDTTAPDALEYRYKGAVRFDWFVRASASTSFGLEFRDPSGTTVALAGPFVADTTEKRIRGELFLSQPLIVATTNGTAQTPTLRLQVTSSGGDLTLIFDPTGGRVSTVSLPGPEVSGTFTGTLGTQTVRLSQPPPDAD